MKKIICVIPSRYNSSRLPGKPILDIAGKPMLFWVYEKCKSITEFDEVIVALDDERIAKVCDQFGMNYIFTRNDHENHIERIYEVSERIKSEIYVCVNGDEPLIESSTIKTMINEIKKHSYDVYGLVKEINNPSLVLDISNIKVVLKNDNTAMYMSRSPIPYPKGFKEIKYLKYVGVEGFTPSALKKFSMIKKSYYETIEDIDHLRFITNGIDIKFQLVKSDSLSVDTIKDYEIVKEMIKNESY